MQILPIINSLIASISVLVLLTSPVQAQVEGMEVVAGEPITELPVLQQETLEGQVISISNQQTASYTQGQDIVTADLEIVVTRGSVQGQTITVPIQRSLSTGEKPIQVGDRLLINKSSDQTGLTTYYVIDFVRTPSLLIAFGIFVALVVWVGRWQGLLSLGGLAASFVIIAGLILPGLSQGYDPILITLVGSGLIILVTFYASHGVNEKTSLAIGGTLLSLALTGVLARVLVGEARLTGYGAEEAVFLQVLNRGELNMSGLLLAGIILATLGVLDDITVSQASIVKELKRANPSLSPSQIFNRAMNVGRDHIASLVNTLVLVYTGTALPLLLLFTFDGSRSLMTVLNYEMVAEEIIRTLVGSIGLVVAVPVTTFLAAYVGFSKRDLTTKSRSS